MKNAPQDSQLLARDAMEEGIYYLKAAMSYKEYLLQVGLLTCCLELRSCMTGTVSSLPSTLSINAKKSSAGITDQYG